MLFVSSVGMCGSLSLQLEVDEHVYVIPMGGAIAFKHQMKDDVEVPYNFGLHVTQLMLLKYI